MPKNAPQYILDLFAKIDALDSKVDDLVKRVTSVEESNAKLLAQVQLLQPSTNGQATPAVPVYKYAQPVRDSTKQDIMEVLGKVHPGKSSKELEDLYSSFNSHALNNCKVYANQQNLWGTFWRDLSREGQLNMINATRKGLLQEKSEELAFIMECQAHWPVAFAVQNSWSEMSKRVNAK